MANKMQIVKPRGISALRALLSKPKEESKAPSLAVSGPTEKPKGAETRRTYLTVPYYTPSDDVDIEKATDEQKRELIRKGKLMMTGHPISITNIRTRKEVLGDWLGAEDFTFDAGTSYKAWTYAWAYLVLAVVTFIWVHPLLAIPLAWKVGHNRGHYIGGLIFGKEDMKGKTMYRTV